MRTKDTMAGNTLLPLKIDEDVLKKTAREIQDEIDTALKRAASERTAALDARFDTYTAQFDVQERSTFPEHLPIPQSRRNKKRRNH